MLTQVRGGLNLVPLEMKLPVIQARISVLKSRPIDDIRLIALECNRPSDFRTLGPEPLSDLGRHASSLYY